MSDRFVLYYWPIPFRAQFARYMLAYAGEPWTEPDRDEVFRLYQGGIAEQPVPFMAPPVLHDRKTDLWISQAPAINSFLGEILGLMPGTPEKDALTRKVLNDCIDVLHGLTRNCGALMWTDAAWEDFANTRLPRWLQVFEELGRRHGLTSENATLLGTTEIGAADLACAALWATIKDKLPELEETLTRHAPNVFAHSIRIADMQPLAALRADQTRKWGNVWCEGQIEASLRNVLSSNPRD